MLSLFISTSVLADESNVPKCHYEITYFSLAREVLRQSPKLQSIQQYVTKKIRVKKGKYHYVQERVMIKRQVALAILDTQTCEVFGKLYWLDSDDIQKANIIRRDYSENPDNLPRFVPDTPDDFSVTVNWWNYFNSDLSVSRNSEADRYIVVGNKFLLSNYPEFVFIPYSSAIHNPELVQLGKEFLQTYVRAAFEDLKALKVRSRAFPGKLVTDTVSEIFMETLFVNEHSDPRLMFLADDGGLDIAQRLFVLLGANYDNTFYYTSSQTGALGIAQIMPGTYRDIVRAYPEANLRYDIDLGRAVSFNAIKAAILICDNQLAAVFRMTSRSPKYRILWNQKKSTEIEEIRAAIYNGGPGKYVPKNGRISPKIRETVDFVKKFKMIRDLNLFR